MNDRFSATNNEASSEETLRRFSLGLLDDDQAQQVADYLEQNPAAAAKAEAIGDDSFIRKMRQAGDAPNSRLAAESMVGITQPVVASQPKVAVQDLQLHPELAALSQYHFVKQLGAGGMSLVYLAENLHMGKRLEALKILNESQLRQTAARERFEQEIAVAARLHHANIVSAYSAMKLPSLRVFAMEYVEGQDLEQFVKTKGPFRIAVACGIIRHVATGLQYAMDMKTVHRDIKPSNLMLTKVGTKDIVKILDFGLAKAQMESGNNHAGLTSTNMGMGTPHYMAPEQLLSAGSVDIRADIYSLGCTLYFLLTGRTPFVGTQYEIYHAHQSSQAEPLNLVRPDVPIELETVVATMMAKEPAKRFQRPEDVFAALTPFLSFTASSTGTQVGSSEHTSVRPEASAYGSRNQSFSLAQLETVSRVALSALEDTTPEEQTVSPIASLVINRAPAEAVKAIRRKTKQRRKLIGLALISLFAVAAGLFSICTKRGTIVFQKLPADANVLVDGEQVTVTWDQSKQQATVTAKPGTHNVEVRQNGIKVEGTKVTVVSGKQASLVVQLEPIFKEPNTETPTPEPLLKLLKNGSTTNDVRGIDRKVF